MGLSLLVVDDSEALRTRVVELLQSARGVSSISQSANVRDALSALRVAAVDVLVLDLSLPDGNGLDVLRAVRRDGMSIAVVVLTNAGLRPYRQKCLDEGADFFLDKSTEFERLVGVVEALAAGESKQ